MTIKKYPVKRLDSSIGLYEYRGYKVWRDDDVSTGYWGRYKVEGIMKGGYYTDTLRDCKLHIEQALEKIDIG